MQVRPLQQSELALHDAPDAPQVGTQVAGEVLKSQVSPGGQQRGQPVP